MDVLSSALPLIKGPAVIIPVLRSLHRPIKALTSIHQRHGDLVLARFFNKKLLFVRHPEHIEEVYAQEARGLLSRDFLYEAKKSLFGDGLVNSKTEIWTKQRRLMQPIFTKEAISEWEKVFIQEATRANARLLSVAPGPINLSIELKQLIQRIFIQVLMGRSVDTLPNSKELIQAIEIISAGLLLQIVAQIISNGTLMTLMPSKNRSYHAAVKQLSDFMSQEVTRQQQTAEHSLISVMQQASDTKTGYSMTPMLLKDEAINLFFAGQDTALNTLAWFFYLIGKNESVHNKITNEVRKYQDVSLNAANLEKMTYTRAALYETLRLYPPAAALATQAIAEVAIDDFAIDQDTIVILSMYAAHRHPGFWEKPNDFYPEHFLNLTSETKRHKYAYFPFGGGLHNCIGRHFAELEMMIIIVTLLRVFTFKTSGDIQEAASITLKPNKDIIADMSVGSDLG
jgi:cytochrome P450